jgi:hypothetical protein
MAAGDTDIGTGTTLTYAGFSMELLSLSWSGISREMIDISHMGTTGGKKFLPADHYDPGELTAEVHLKTDEAPPITADMSTLTIVLPQPDGGTWSCQAALSSFEFNDPMEDKMTATAVWKCSEDITFPS